MSDYINPTSVNTVFSKTREIKITTIVLIFWLNKTTNHLTNFNRIVILNKTRVISTIQYVIYKLCLSKLCLKVSMGNLQSQK